MDLFTIIFYLFALLTVGAAATMAFSKNIVRSAFALMFALMGVAALYVFLHADFVALTQLLVYVGGILVLVLFGVMLTTQGLEVNFKTTTVNLLPAAILAICIAGILLFVMFSTSWNITANDMGDSTINALGYLLMYEYLLPFQVAGVLLLIAIIGAILMVTKRRQKTQ